MENYNNWLDALDSSYCDPALDGTDVDCGTVKPTNVISTSCEALDPNLGKRWLLTLGVDQTETTSRFTTLLWLSASVSLVMSLEKVSNVADPHLCI